MNPVEHVLDGELSSLLERLAASVPEGCLETISGQRPTLRMRLEDVETNLAMVRASLIEGYGRWRRVLDDLENVWALAAWRSGQPEEPAERAPALAA